MRRFLIVGGLLGGLVGTFLVGLLVGALMGEWGAKTRRFRQERALFASVLADDPSFRDLEIAMYSGDGSAHLAGEVATAADYDRVRSKMLKLMGESRTERTDGVDVAAMDGVEVREARPDTDSLDPGTSSMPDPRGRGQPERPARNPDSSSPFEPTP